VSRVVVNLPTVCDLATHCIADDRDCFLMHGLGCHDVIVSPLQTYLFRALSSDARMASVHVGTIHC
jgi:hypothetical protein